MALKWTVIEKWESGDGTSGRNAEDRLFAIIQGPAAATGDNGVNGDDYLQATIELGTIFPSVSKLGNVLEDIKRTRIAPYTWLGEAVYKSQWDMQPTGEAAFSFTTGGATQHVDFSISTRGAFTAGPAPIPYVGNNPIVNYNQAINFTGDSVEGVDIHIRSFDFKTTYYVSQANLNPNYVQQLYSLTGNINSDTVNLNVDGVVCNFAPGELLFLGAEGSKRHGIADWEIALSWAGIPNQNNLTIGAVTGIVKRGWDYLWVLSSPDTDPVTGAYIVPKVQQVNIEQVYYESPLSPLLASTTFGTTAAPWQVPGNTFPDLEITFPE